MDGSAVDRDQRARLAAFNFQAEQTQLYSEVLPRAILANGFTFESTRVPLIGPRASSSWNIPPWASAER